MNRLKIAVITEGGKNIGFGHLTRCLSLCSELEKKGIKSSLVVNKDRSIAQRLIGKKISMYDTAGEILALIKGFDCAIVDSYKLDRDFYLRVRQEVRLLVCIDDNNRMHYPAGIVINGSAYAEELRYPQGEDIIYLLGPKFIPIREAFGKIREKDIKKRLTRMLIIFGGDDSKKMTAKIRDFILKRFPELKLDIIIGGVFQDKEKIIGDTHNRVQYHYNVDAKVLMRLMSKADIAISAGGQTLYELAITGTPAIGICVADNQVNNLEALAEYGFLKYCGWYDEPGLFEKLGSAILNIRDKAIRRKMGRLGQRLIDGKGAERIVDNILKMNFRRKDR